MLPRFAALVRAARPVLAGVIAIAFVLLLVLGLRIHQALGELRGVATDSLQWNLSQLEVDLLRLQEEIRVEALRPTASLDELRKRFDLFYSRAQNAISGSGYSAAGLEDLSKSLSDMLDAYLTRETPLIDGPDDMLIRNLPAMAARLDALHQEVRGTSIQLIERQARLGDARRDAFSVLVRRMGLATVTTIGLLLCLLVLLVSLNRIAQRESRQTAQVTRRLAATVNSALEAIIVADAQGRIIQYNPSAESIFGFPREAVMGRDLATLIMPEPDPAAQATGMARLYADGTARPGNGGRIQSTALDCEGREFPVELSVSAAEGDDGRIFIVFLRDISERLTAEAALTRARDDALAAERAKSEFLAVMSHEMRTPLNGVLASLEIAARKASDPEQKRFIALAQESAELLLRHANDVLDISRIESGAPTLTSEVFDLAAHVSGLVETVRPICDERHIALNFKAPPGSVLLKGDPFRLGQIVQNFLSNAIKFVETGGITVEAEVIEATAGQRRIEIRVTDTGPGIAPEDQGRIFDDFVMLDPSFHRIGGGAGLGLAISRRLAKAMGGEIGVKSAPGQGSCFWLRLTLPLAEGRIEDSETGAD
ncbi:MAG: PAS domain-containing sensor histidine kinase, partial [Paracoccus sp. (in: a-proteobacteria)]